MYNKNMYTTDEKYLPLEIGVRNNPIIIVGQNPGRTRQGKYSKYVWDGDTRTSNLLHRAIAPYTNIVLTNVCNYQDMSLEHTLEGWFDLQDLFEEFKPCKVICLGNYAHQNVRPFGDRYEDDMATISSDIIVKLPHPSYIVRFNKDEKEYIINVRKELDEVN